MKTPKISIIIPIYNIDEYINDCIKSVVNQTYKNIEIILVDDGSTDKCPQICDEWSVKDKRIKVIHKKNGGLVSARKAGIESSMGRYIGYVDGDDWIEPDMYEKMITVIEQEDVDIVISGFKKNLYGKTSTYYNKIPKGIYRGEELAQKIFPTMICDKDTHQYGLYTYVWNKLFKKEKLYPHQMQVDNRIVVGEDAACVYPAIIESNSIAVIEEAGYHYRQRMNSLLRETNREANKISQLQIFYEYMLCTINKSKYKTVLKSQLDYFYCGYLIMLSDCLVHEYPTLGSNFPFLNIKQDSQIIIYSAGAYGLHVYKQISESNSYNVVAWADPDYEKYKESAYSVVSLERALEYPYDYFIIASIDFEFITQTKELLSIYHVDMDKVVSVIETFDTAIVQMKKAGIVHQKVLM